MSDENIIVSVDQAEIDAAIAKLDEALAKTSQLTGQTQESLESGSRPLSSQVQAIYGKEQFYTIPNSEMAQASAKQNIDFFTLPNSEMEELNAQVEETQANVDEVVADSKEKLDGVLADVEEAEAQTDDVVASEGTEIKGLESASSRVIRMIPGLREAQRIQRSLGALSAGSLVGVVGLLMVAYSIYRQISAMLEEQKQQQADYKKTIMDVRGFTTSAQFIAWQAGQRQAIENSYRPGIIP